MNVKDFQCRDLIELFWDEDFRKVLSDEFDIDEVNNLFVADEDDTYYYSFNAVSKVWREDENGNYILIYNKDKVEKDV